MLKRAAAFLVALLMLTSVVFAEGGSGTEYTEPTAEEKAAMTEKLSYSFFLSEFEEGTLPSDDDIMSYIEWSGEFWEGGAFNKYGVASDYVTEYTIPYDLLISTVDKYFANHSDMKEYFGEKYDKASNTVKYSISSGMGGFGIDMYPERFLRVKDKNEYHVLGVELDVMFDETLTDDMKPHVDYFPQVAEDGRVFPCYVNGCFEISFVKDGNNFRISGMKSIDYYTSDGKVYLRGSSDYPDVRKLAGIYNSLTVEADGASVSCESAREFGYLSGLWLPESTEVTFKILPEDGIEVESVTYNDGTEKTLTPTGSGLYKVKTGESAVTLTVKTKTAEPKPPVETDEVTALPETDAATEPAAPETETGTPGTETGAPGTDTGDVGDEGGCGSVMSVSAVAAAAAVAVLAVFKRRH